MGAVYLLKAAGVFAAVMAVALPYRRTHHPFERCSLANAVTTTRAGLVALVVVGVTSDRRQQVTELFLLRLQITACGVGGGNFDRDALAHHQTVAGHVGELLRVVAEQA